MENQPLASIDAYDDISSHGQYKIALEHGCTPAQALEYVHFRSRDNGRYPFSWTDGDNAGFTAGKPWLPASPDRVRINAQRELADPESLFHVYRRLLALRKEGDCRDALVDGAMTPYLPEQKHLLAYWRHTGSIEDNGALLILCNYQNAPQRTALPGGAFGTVYDNYGRNGDVTGGMELRPYEAAILRRK